MMFSQLCSTIKVADRKFFYLYTPLKKEWYTVYFTYYINMLNVETYNTESYFLVLVEAQRPIMVRSCSLRKSGFLGEGSLVETPL